MIDPDEGGCKLQTSSYGIARMGHPEQNAVTARRLAVRICTQLGAGKVPVLHQARVRTLTFDRYRNHYWTSDSNP